MTVSLYCWINTFWLLWFIKTVSWNAASARGISDIRMIYIFTLVYWSLLIFPLKSCPSWNQDGSGSNSVCAFIFISHTEPGTTYGSLPGAWLPRSVPWLCSVLTDISVSDYRGQKFSILFLLVYIFLFNLFFFSLDISLCIAWIARFLILTVFFNL